MPPLVTVCIPTYNHAHFLPDSLRSALEQTERDLEILVVDNCSSDDTETVVREFCCSDKRVRYVRNSVNLGLVGNLNKCLELASGTYVKFLLADDLLEPDCVREMLKELESTPECTLVASRRQLVNRDLRPLRVAGFKNLCGLLDGQRIIGYTLFNGNYIGEPTAVLFRKRDALRGFSAEYKRLVDVEMWFQLLENGALVYIDKPLVISRQHETQETHGLIRSLDFIDEEIELYQSYVDKPYIRATLVQCLKWRFKTAWIYPFAQAGEADCREVRHRIRRQLGIDLLTLVLVARILLSRLTRLCSTKSLAAK
jgi:glycosyltransferase involved in cell wall biosynthesis